MNIYCRNEKIQDGRQDGRKNSDTAITRQLLDL